MKHVTNNTNITKYIVNYFDEEYNVQFFDVVKNIIARVDDLTDSYDIDLAIDDGFIYVEDHWAVAVYYARDPSTLDWDNVMAEFTQDLHNLCCIIAQDIDDKDSDEDGDGDFSEDEDSNEE